MQIASCNDIWILLIFLFTIFIEVHRCCNFFFWFLQVVGHSLGGGTAALLTYILREQKELSTTTCVTFAPGLYTPYPICAFSV